MYSGLTKVLNSTSSQEYGDWYWSSDNLCQDYDRRGAQVDKASDGDFNNLDYMMLFNLYNLNDRDYLGKYFNNYYLEDLRTNYYDFPYYLGSSSMPLTLNYLEYLSLRNRHAKGTNVSYRGAKVVDLKPGFLADSGSTVLVYVKDYDCRKDDYHFATVRGRYVAGKGTDESAETGGDEEIPVEYAPDAVDYHVNEIAGNPEWSEPDSTFMPTQDDEQQYLDSMINDVYASGDSVLIGQIDSLLPYYDIPVVQSRGTSNNNVAGHTSSLQSIIYPNPSSGKFTLVLASPSSGHLKVLNALGTNVYEKDLNREQRIIIDLGTNLSPGNYTLQLETERGRDIKKLTILR